MRHNVIKQCLATLVLILGLVLAGCGDEFALNPQQDTPTAIPTAAPSPTANGDTVAQVPAASPSASPVAQQTSNVTSQNNAPNEQVALTEYESIVNNVYQRNISAVVNLSDAGSTGSGFVIDNQGHIVTNNHVIANMRRISVTFSDRSRTEATLVGTFPEGDIAVVRVDDLPVGVQPVTLGNSSNVQIGQITIAIGSPLGLQQTVTSGIVSALNRSLQDLGEVNPDSSLHGLIQTDASINPGNSGGPLFNGQGEVIGMNTLIASLTQGNVGLGFAVPVNRIKRVANQLIETGEYRRPVLGIRIQVEIPGIAEELDLPTGVMIAAVDPGGPADQAGLRGATEFVRVQVQNQVIEYPTNGDVIVALDSQEVVTLGDLRNILETEHEAGDTVTITFLRDGQELQTELTLAS